MIPPFYKKLLSICISQSLHQSGFESLSLDSLNIMTDTTIFIIEKIIKDYINLNIDYKELKQFLKIQNEINDGLERKVGIKSFTLNLLKFVPDNFQCEFKTVVNFCLPEKNKNLSVNSFMEMFIRRSLGENKCIKEDGVKRSEVECIGDNKTCGEGGNRKYKGSINEEKNCINGNEMDEGKRNKEELIKGGNLLENNYDSISQDFNDLQLIELNDRKCIGELKIDKNYLIHSTRFRTPYKNSLIDEFLNHNKVIDKEGKIIKH